MLTPLYTALRDRILAIPASALPANLPAFSGLGIAWVDLWNNQIDHLSEENPIRYPALFIEIATDWQQAFNDVKRGTATIKLYIVQETIGMDTYTTNLPPLGAMGAGVALQAAGQAQAFAQLEFIDTINTYLQGYSSTNLNTPPFGGASGTTFCFYPLDNTATRHDTNTNELRIDTLDYTCAVEQVVNDPYNLPVTAIIIDTLINPIDIVPEL